VKIGRFDSPAPDTDFVDIPKHVEAWNEVMSYSFDTAGDTVGGAAGHFYNPTSSRGESPQSESVAEISWEGFPKTLELRYGLLTGREVAEELRLLALGSDKDGLPVYAPYRQQDEYCEWFVRRNSDGRITRIEFTCEGPEYWSSLANGYPSPYFYGADPNDPPAPRTFDARGSLDRVVELYRAHVSPDVEPADLTFVADVFEDFELPDKSLARVKIFSAGDYNPWNVWNTSAGAMHLSHPANTLRAEIQLAADGTVRRARNGSPVEEAQQLICCAGFGGVNRASDPTIGSQVNELARADALITLQNPVGLFMKPELDVSGFVTPDGSPAASYWTITRATPGGLALRAVYETPPDQFFVDDVTIDGEPIQYGGQIARRIAMVLIGVATNPGSLRTEPRSCDARCCRSKTNPTYLKATEVTSPCVGAYEEAFPIAESALPTLHGSVEAAAVLHRGAAASRIPASRRLRRTALEL
jgi:hypothetical protein